MNCDTAFDLMTDPHGLQSSTLQQHLEGCPRCRQMKEALSPALGFFENEANSGFSDNSRDESDAFEFPREPMVTVEAVQIAQFAAARLMAVHERRSVRLMRSIQQVAKYSASFAAGALLAILWWTSRDRDESPAAVVCSRQQALETISKWTPEEVQSLVQSCAKCHRELSERHTGNHSASSRIPNFQSWDWLVRALDENGEPSAQQAEISPLFLIADFEYGRNGPEKLA